MFKYQKRADAPTAIAEAVARVFYAPRISSIFKVPFGSS